MADGRFAEEAAATDLCDDSRVPRERHKKRMLDHHNSHVIHNNNYQGNSHVIINKNTTILSNVDGGSCGDDVGDDSEISCASDDSHNNDDTIRYNIKNNNNKNNVFNIDCSEIKSIFNNNNNNNNKSSSLNDNCIINNTECDIIIKNNNNLFNEKINIDDNNMVVMVGFSVGSINNKFNDKNDDDDDNNSTAIVLDSAAAAVAVSAIPEAIKDIKKITTTTTTSSLSLKSSKTIISSSLIKDKCCKRRSGDDVVARLGCAYKGQIRNSDDSLVGPCGKKRCADRYDSSESSDSGVAVSCGECSSSGTSDITEPGSPCSTSSDEGVAICGTTASPLSSLPKLAPPTTSTHNGTRPQWPWTPPLAITACTTTTTTATYKRLRSEPEIATLPKSGAVDPSTRNNNNKTTNKLQNNHDTQGKITEYFKTQIKPQGAKIKKNSTEMSVLIAKSSPEFRRPQTVQRNKNGLAKYLGVVLPNSRKIDDWNSKTIKNSSLSTRPLLTPAITVKKLPIGTPRVTVTKLDKKLISKALPGLPISSDVLSSITGCKISSLRLTSDASPNVINNESSSISSINNNNNNINEPVGIDFTSFYKKSIVNENNNITSINHTRLTNGKEHLLSRLSSGLLDSSKDIKTSTIKSTTKRKLDDDEEEEDDDESKPSLSSPILSAPTTIRFPARVPTKNNRSNTDSGICRWDKCDANFECIGTLLEHLQTAHINTQTGGDNFVCHWQGCKVQGRSSCSRRWLERHVLSHGGNKPFRCIVDGCGSGFSSQPALERHVNNHFNQSETSSSSGRRSCENGKLVRRNGKKLRYRRQPWSARLFDYIDTGIMEGLQHRLLEISKTRTQGNLAETPGDSIALTSQILAKRVEMDGKTKVLLRWYPRDIEPDEWVAESQVQKIKHISIKKAASVSTDEVNNVLYPALHGGTPPLTRVKQRRKPVKNS